MEGKEFNFEQGRDYYLDKGQIVLTESYLKRRGRCCGGKCRYCPYNPSYIKGNTELKEYLKK